MMSLSSLGATASDFAFREGDIVFRSGKNYPVMYISGSTITHCGIDTNTITIYMFFNYFMCKD